MLEQIATAVLEYGPLKFPLALHGTRNPDGSESYEYGVASLPDGVSGSQAADYRSDLMGIANRSYAFGISNLYFDGEPLPE